MHHLYSVVGNLLEQMKELANAGLALAGMYRRVGWFNWHTCSKVGRL